MTERLKPLKGDGAQLLKLLTTASDIQSLQQGLELASALAMPIEGLLDGVDVSAVGELVLSSRFKGTRSMQPTLDAVLLHQLSMAQPGSKEEKIRLGVKRLSIECHLAPFLKGFEALESLELTLLPDSHWADLSTFGPMPLLENLTIMAKGEKTQKSSLETLQGLHAPKLQIVVLRELNLRDISALQASPKLVFVNLALNAQLQSIDPLISSVLSIGHLELEACGTVPNIQALHGSVELIYLDLKDCENITSLLPLSESVALTTVNLEGCAKLESLEGLAGQELLPFSWTGFDLSGCLSLTSLNHLPTLSPEVDSVNLKNMPKLQSLEGIGAAKSIESLTLDRTALVHLNELADLHNLNTLHVTRCQHLVDASALGPLGMLSSASFVECKSLSKVPTVWDSALERLKLWDCAVDTLGHLPAGLTDLELRECPKLVDLKGIETSSGLDQLIVDTHLQDASAISGFQALTAQCLRVGGSGAISPSWWGQVFGKVSPLRLDLRFTGLAELQFLVELDSLRMAMVSQEAVTFYELKKDHFRNEAEAKTLQRAICKKHSLPLPTFLKPRRASKLSHQEGGLSPAILKTGLTSTDFSAVLLALGMLRAEGSPQLYDDLLEGVDPLGLYTGATAELGKIFKDIKAPYRGWARWVITRILLDAPDKAALAADIRNSIQAMEMTLDLRHGQEPKDSPPPLTRFTSLKRLTLQGIACFDLYTLSEAPPIESLILKNMEQLQSLEGLEGLTSLQMLTLENCPALTSLKGLEGSQKLKQIKLQGCDKVSDFSAMEHLTSLETFNSYEKSISFYNFAPLKDISFICGLQSATSIHLKLTGSVDLSPLAKLTALESLELEVDTLDMDFSCLLNLRNLTVKLECDATSGPSTQHIWNAKLPMLESLEVQGGRHVFNNLQAPKLNSFESYGCQLSDFHGVGHANNVQFTLDGCNSLEGLEGSPLESLDLYYSERHVFKNSVSVVHKLPNLKTLRIGNTLSLQHIQELKGCEQIKAINARGYSGSLSFLQGWNNLTQIDLRDSGELSDIETLCDLVSLVNIRLRGSAMKRNTWPKVLQERLDFLSS